MTSSPSQVAVEVFRSSMCLHEPLRVLLSSHCSLCCISGFDVKRLSLSFWGSFSPSKPESRAQEERPQRRRSFHPLGPALAEPKMSEAKRMSGRVWHESRLDRVDST